MRRFPVLLVIALAAAPALAQDPLAAFPGNYRRIFENSAVDVVRVHYGPNEAVGIHDHSAYPTLYVYLNNSGPVRFEHHEAKLEAVTRPPTTAGAYRLSPGRRERHSVRNLSATPSDFLRIELKQLPLGSVVPFRGAPPQRVTHAGGTMEVRQPAIQVERLLCADEHGCPLPPSASPSLLVALTPLSLSAQTNRLSSLPLERFDLGAVRWLAASGSGEAVPQTNPAQLLRIFLPSQ